MEYTLHKLKEGFVITSDEEIETKDKVYPKTNNIYGGNNISTCLSFGKNSWSKHIITELTDERGYHPSHLLKVIAQQDQIDFSALKPEEQKEIGWFDIEKLAYESLKNNLSYIGDDLEALEDLKIKDKEMYDALFNAFKDVFQKAQELLSDKVFTLEDMKKALSMQKETMGINQRNQFAYKYKNSEEIIQSLFKNSWKIELEMTSKNGLGNRQPEFTNGKVKILKIQ